MNRSKLRVVLLVVVIAVVVMSWLTADGYNSWSLWPNWGVN